MKELVASESSRDFALMIGYERQRVGLVVHEGGELDI